MRLRSRDLLVLAATTALLAMSHPARASQIAYEGFSPSFPIYANGGTGFNGPWTQGGFNAFASGYTPTESSLCVAKLRTGGGSISGGAFSAINGAIRSLALPLGRNNTTVYMSFLIRPQGTLNKGLFGGFFGVTLNGSLGNDLFIGKPGGGAAEQYVLEARGGSGQVTSGTATEVGRVRQNYTFANISFSVSAAAAAGAFLWYALTPATQLRNKASTPPRRFRNLHLELATVPSGAALGVRAAF